MDSPTHNSASPITRWLSRAPAPAFVAYAIAASFGVYFCMYAFRKPFDVVTLEGQTFLSDRIGLKTACAIGQTLGYLVSKYLGGKVCSEARPSRRAILLVSLVLAAEVALVIFAAVPGSWMPLAMFLNGLPLGMVWGLVVRYLEGRRFTETLLLGLSTSFIIADGMVKDVGNHLVEARGVPEWWMPAATGALFVVPLLLMVWLLDKLPPPSAIDVEQRSARPPMDARQRRAFLAYFSVGFVALLVAYFFLTAHREFRGRYVKEMFKQMDFGRGADAIFTRTESWAFFGVIVAMVGLNAIRDHRRALVAAYGIMVLGFAVVGAATLMFQAGQMGIYEWMATIGLGMYLAYVPFGAVLFERMMAASRFQGTSVFAIQLADGVGYTGAVLIQIFHDLVHGIGDRVGFFVGFSLVTSAVGIVFMGGSLLFVLRRVSHSDSAADHDKVAVAVKE